MREERNDASSSEESLDFGMTDGQFSPTAQSAAACYAKTTGRLQRANSGGVMTMATQLPVDRCVGKWEINPSTGKIECTMVQVRGV